jgi:outer membrane protein assembly factor BamB
MVPLTVGINVENCIVENNFFNNYHIFEISNFKQDIYYEPQICKNKELDKVNYSERTTNSFDVIIGSAWPMKCYNSHHTSQSPFSTANNPGIEKWRFHFTGWLEDTPIIGNDGIIYCKGAYDYLDRYLFAIYPNGTEKWKFKTDGLILGSSPAIAEDGTIYVGSWDTRLYALNPDGTMKWKIGTGGSIASSPVITDDGTVYLGNYGKKIVAVNPNGTIKWYYNTEDDITSDPAIANDGTIYIGSMDSYLYAMNPDGSLKWRFKTGDRIYGSPSIAEDGTIYIGSSWDSYLYALYPNGTLKWKYKGAGTPNNPSIASDGTIYAGYLDKLVALSPDGTLKWKFDIGDNRHIGKSAPAISADGTIYFGTHIGESNGGEIIAVNPDGTEKWRKKIANKWVESSPSITEDGTVYIGSSYEMSKGYLHAFGSVESNAPPESPTIEGPPSGKIDTKYTFILQSTDPDRNPISYYVNWGDGTNSGWTEDVNTGESVSLRHTWEHVNTFTIRARVKDTFGLESDSTTFQIKISNPRTRTWLIFMDVFPILQKILNYIL